MKILREDGNGDRPEKLEDITRVHGWGALLGLERERKGGKDGGRDGALKREGGREDRQHALPRAKFEWRGGGGSTECSRRRVRTLSMLIGIRRQSQSQNQSQSLLHTAHRTLHTSQTTIRIRIRARQCGGALSAGGCVR